MLPAAVAVLKAPSGKIRDDRELVLDGSGACAWPLPVSVGTCLVAVLLLVGGVCSPLYGRTDLRSGSLIVAGCSFLLTADSGSAQALLATPAASSPTFGPLTA